MNKIIILSMSLLLLIGNMARGQSWCNVFLTDNAEVSCINTTPKDELIEDDHQHLRACKGSTITYVAHYSLSSPDTLVSLTWTIVGADHYTINNSNHSVEVTWGDDSRGEVYVDIVSSSGATCSDYAEVELIDRPTIGIASVPSYSIINGQKIIYVCYDSPVYFSDASECEGNPIVAYHWKSSFGTSASASYSIENVTQGTVVYHRVYNNCGCYDEDSVFVKVIKGEPLRLSCYGTVCEGSTATYNVLNYNCSRYNWYIDGGQILSGQGSPSVTVQWGSPACGYGVLGIDGNNCSGNICPDMTSVKIPIITNNATITGETTVCTGKIGYTYSVPLYGSTEYNWSISPASTAQIRSINGANEVEVYFSAPGDYTLKVSYRCDFLDCGYFSAEPLVIHAKPRLQIDGPAKVCLSDTAVLTLNDTTYAVQWVAYDVATDLAVFDTIGKKFIHKFATAGRYRITATSTEFCNTPTFLLEVMSPPAPPVASDFSHPDTIIVCPKGFTMLKGTPSNPNYIFEWESACETATPATGFGDSLSVMFHGEVCDYRVYYLDYVLGCRSEAAYVQPIREFSLAEVHLPETVRVCPGTTIHWTGAEVPYQEGVLYRWYIEDENQRCITAVDTLFSNEVTFRVTSQDAPITYRFYVTLERRYCDTVHYDTVYFSLYPDPTFDIEISPNPAEACEGIWSSVSLLTPPTGSNVYWKFDNGLESEGYHYSANYMGTNSGTYSVSAFCNGNYDYCDNRAFWKRAIGSIIIHPNPNWSNPMYDISAGTVSVQNRSSYSDAPYTFSWNYEGTEYNVNSSSIGYMGPGKYCCTIENVHQCKRTFCTTMGGEGRPCDDIELTFVSMDCKGTVNMHVNRHPATVSWSYSGPGHARIIPSGNNDSDATFIFDRVGTYIISAYCIDGEECYYGEKDVTVCAILDVDIRRDCHNIIVQNHSQSLYGGTIDVVVTNSRTGMSFTDQFNVSDDEYTIIFPSNPEPEVAYILNFSLPNSCGLVCDDEIKIKFDKIPDSLVIKTANTLSQELACDNTSIGLWIEGANGEDMTGLIEKVDWHYGDDSYETRPGHRTEHTFRGPNICIITAYIVDTNGCSHSASAKITVNKAPETSLVASDSNRCSGTLIKLIYSADPTTENNIYNWRLPVRQNPTMHSIGEIYYQGNYSVFVINQSYCKDEQSKAVPYRNIPPSNFCTDKPSYCQKDNVHAVAVPGNYQYRWMITAESGNVPDINASNNICDFIAEESGTYTIELTVSDDTCSSTTVQTIIVHPKPQTPVIEYAGNPCIDNPPVQLQISNSCTSRWVHWSNGAYSDHADYYTAGYVTAYYVDTITGCPSDNAKFDIPPAPNFDGLLTGCYEKCPKFFDYMLPAYALTANRHAVYWEWFLNNGFLDRGVVNSPLRPALLKLIGPGTYHMDAQYGVNCTVTSPTLTIDLTKECRCDSLILTNHNVEVHIENCHIFATGSVTVTNAGYLDACLRSVQLSLPSDFANLYYQNISQTLLHHNDRATISFSFTISNPLLTHIPITVFDSCNNCKVEFVIPIEIKIPPCDDEELRPISVTPNPSLSNRNSVYFNMDFDLGNMGSLWVAWSEPPALINYVNVGTRLSALAMFDRGILSQLANDDSVICIHAIGCTKDNILCEKTWCIHARELKIASPKQSDMDGNASTDNEPRPYLQPNPARSSFAVKGVDEEKVSEITLIDMNGRVLGSVVNTAEMSVSRFVKGAYIVRIVSKDNKVYYLKLIKE